MKHTQVLRKLQACARQDPQALAEGITEIADERDRLKAINAELVEVAQAVVDRWESPLWKDLPATAGYIAGLRAAINKAKGES
jgi:hypothetical protein